MKRRYLTLILLMIVVFIFCSSVYAKKYKFNKVVNPAQLADELKEAGINLLGKDQVGYMETVNGREIRIVTKDGVTIDEVGLNDVIATHVPRDYEAEKKVNEDAAIIRLKKLGFTNAEIKAVLKK